ncbi:MAG: metal ABC transporter permease, partial [Bacteroidales bacterium]|nr:metal ABC transporter permease [Bacteroidales bacterium]
MESIYNLLQYGFFQNALVASMLASIACGLAGAYVVSRRMVFLSGGISHASFGGIGLAFFLGIYPPLGALVFAVASAMLIQYLSDRQEVRNDSAVGILWSAGMAVGIIFVYLTPGYVPNLMTYLFGNILTVGPADLWMLGLAAILAVAAFIGFFPLVLAVAFDENYARVRHVPARLINYLLMALVALTIVTSIRVAG